MCLLRVPMLVVGRTFDVLPAIVASIIIMAIIIISTIIIIIMMVNNILLLVGSLAVLSPSLELGFPPRAGARVWDIGAIDDPVVAWRKIVALPRCAVAVVRGGIIYWHMSILQHLAHLRWPL